MTFTPILLTQKLTGKIGCLVLIATRHDNRPAIKPNILNHYVVSCLHMGVREHNFKKIKDLSFQAKDDQKTKYKDMV